nr:hypothetical protein [Nitrosomonas nitrosa]
MMNDRGKRKVQVLAILIAGLCVVPFCDMQPEGYAKPNSSDPFLIHVVNPTSGEKILPTTFPLPGSQSTKIQVVACRGEYEPASFVIRGLNRAPLSILVSVSDLVGEHGVIPKEHVDIKVVKTWYQAATAWSSHIINKSGRDTRVLVPELLLNDEELIRVDVVNKNNYVRLPSGTPHRYESISDNTVRNQPDLPGIAEFPVRDADQLQPSAITENSNKQYWITVHVPEDTRSGKYLGAISITTTQGHALVKLDYEINVLPFELSNPSIEYSVYYRGKLAPRSPTVSSEFKSEEQLKAELRNMREHGVINPTVYQRYRPKGELVPTSIHESQELLRRYLAIRSELNMTNTALYYLGRQIDSDSPGNLKQLEADIPDLQKIKSEYSFTELFLYGKDEARGQELLEGKKAREKVRTLGAKVFSAGYQGHFEVMGQLTDILVLHGLPISQEANKFHRIGHKIYSYHNPQTGPENPALFRIRYGLRLWQADFDGAMIYAYQHSMGSIWNDFDHVKYRDHVLAYPTSDGVIDTIAWEGLREGIDDVRYLSTLENHIKALQSNPVVAQEVKQANAYLLELKDMKVLQPHEVRSEVIGLIMRINTAMSQDDMR